MFTAFHKVFTTRALGQSWLRYENADVHMETQILAYLEIKLLRDFTDKANRLGLPVPEIEKILNQPRGDFPNFPDYITMGMPKLVPSAERFQTHLHNEQFWPGLYTGLAQHHGIPTKLLDFSFNPMNAVHFAVKAQEASDICIWAVNAKYFQHKLFWPWEGFMFQMFSDRMLALHSIIRMPNNTNTFLHHQQGLFIYSIFPYDYYYRYRRYPSFLDHLDLIANHVNRDSPKHFGEHAYKLVLPRDHYFALKTLIRKLGITLSSLMPTFDNVASEIRSEDNFTFY
jgi:hypothetical protein